jgi:phosphopantothenoylcysteine decarboxylase/phosphopantothenate--cysteine ligase
MLSTCLAEFEKADGAILSAAVADYRPKSPAALKLKRKMENISIELEPNPDIAATLGKMKQPGQILAGFALETDNEVANAQEKLTRKNFDFIILNSLKDKGSGFNSDTNKITIINKDNKITTFELKPKYDVAVDIINYLENLFHK